MRINKIITKQEALDCQTDSPCQYLKKRMENSMENMHTDIRV